METTETIEAAQARHRKELKDLQNRITSKKKNATKKTRKGVNDECAELERRTKERQEEELASLRGEKSTNVDEDEGESDQEEDVKPTDATDANGVVTKLAETTISDPPAAQQPKQEGGGGAGGGNKKRNRQKERLARRAAEREADSAAAATEASQMKDHRAIEREALEKSFKAQGRALKEIAPDGHCLFSAVADQLGLQGIPLDHTTSIAGDPGYKVVRRVATDYMLSNPDDFAPFLIDEETGELGDLKEHATKMRDTAEWGGNLELMALANGYGVTIKVVQEGRIESIEPKTTDAGNEGEKKQAIWLAYYRHGYGLGEHYNSLRPAKV